MDRTKPVILLVGHNPLTGVRIADYLKEHNLQDKVELAGICCTAHEVTRHDDHAKVIGPLSRQLFFVRCGIADVIVTDEQCIRTDIPIEAAKAGSAFIATCDKACYGLEDLTKKGADEIIEGHDEKRQAGSDLRSGQGRRSRGQSRP